MKIYPAIGVLEFDDIPAGVVATDAMLKKAPIAFFKSGTITRGRYLTVLGGTPASADEAVQEGLRAGGSHVLDHVLLPDVHARLYDAILGVRHARASRALAIVETSTVAASIRGAEAALKGTPVELIELRMADIGLAGKALFVLDGDLHDIEAAIALAVQQASQRGASASWQIVPAPHDALVNEMLAGTRFNGAPLIELDGESV
ncbi:MAG: BMC domain-containing protein [Bacteroidales bacterium]